MFRKKTFWIGIIILCLVGGGYWGYRTWFAPAKATTDETVKQTATVTVGDLSISAAGSGVLFPGAEINLAFSSSGTLTELLVNVADEVQAGEILAKMDDAEARKAVAAAELQVIQAQQALALAEGDAQLKVAQTQAAYDTVQDALDALVDFAPDETEVKIAKANLDSAQASYWNTTSKAGLWGDQIASTRISLENAVTALADAQATYTQAMDPARDWERNIEDTRDAAANGLLKAQQNLEIAQASYNLNTINTSQSDVQSAYVKLLSAQTDYDALTSPPDESELSAARLAVQEQAQALQQAQLALMDLGNGETAATCEAALTLEQAELNLASAQKALEETTLVAPFAGTITTVNGQVGESINGTVLVLADLAAPVMEFWVEESDMGSVAVDYPVKIVFTALPDFTYTGIVYQIDPQLVTIGNTPAVQAWATIDAGAHPAKLLADMNAEIEIVAGEALNAFLVPVQALRQLGDDQYAVFVVLDNGDLEMRFVEVGLMDFVNAQILSGLNQGDVVSLGETTVSSSTSQSQSVTTQTQNQPGMFHFFGE